MPSAMPVAGHAFGDAGARPLWPVEGAEHLARAERMERTQEPVDERRVPQPMNSANRAMMLYVAVVHNQYMGIYLHFF